MLFDDVVQARTIVFDSAHRSEQTERPACSTDWLSASMPVSTRCHSQPNTRRRTNSPAKPLAIARAAAAEEREVAGQADLADRL